MVLWVTVNAAFLILAYLLGSLPTGYLAGLWLLGVDIRQQGSGSTGATNVLRTLGKGPAVGVLSVDVLKGVAAVILMRLAYSWETLQQMAATAGVQDLENLQPWMMTLAGLISVIGHSKSIWLGFAGGKSVATSFGVLLGLYWPVGLGTLGIFGLVLAISRIVSLGSIAGAIGVTGLMFAAHQPLPYQLLALICGIFVIVRHRSNIQRLMQGTEPRIGEKLSPES